MKTFFGLKYTPHLERSQPHLTWRGTGSIHDSVGDFIKFSSQSKNGGWNNIFSVELAGSEVDGTISAERGGT